MNQSSTNVILSYHLFVSVGNTACVFDEAAVDRLDLLVWLGNKVLVERAREILWILTIVMFLLSCFKLLVNHLSLLCGYLDLHYGTVLISRTPRLLSQT